MSKYGKSVNEFFSYAKSAYSTCAAPPNAASAKLTYCTAETAHSHRSQKWQRRAGWERSRPEGEMIMTTKTFDSALDFVPAKSAPAKGVLAVISESFAAIREGIAIAGEYKELTNRGVPSDVAARKVFEHIGK